MSNIFKQKNLIMYNKLNIHYTHKLIINYLPHDDRSQVTNLNNTLPKSYLS